MKRTGGHWDAQGENIYFIASPTGTLVNAMDVHEYVLVAVNEMSGRDVELLEEWCANGVKVLIDSGVYNLSLMNAKARGISFYEALTLKPEELSGFSALFEKYCGIVERLGNKVWGYIEVDQGGIEGKKRIRDSLEYLGHAPIPVYHPLSDGWDYFDDLASQYDRICVGNVVNSPVNVRRRIVATLWERQQQYPNLWIHLLGYTPSEQSCAYPINSCDSSTWLRAIRWPAPPLTDVALTSMALPNGYKYRLGAEADAPDSHVAAKVFGGYSSRFLMQNWRGMIRAYNQCGLSA